MKSAPAVRDSRPETRPLRVNWMAGCPPLVTMRPTMSPENGHSNTPELSAPKMVKVVRAVLPLFPFCSLLGNVMASARDEVANPMVCATVMRSVIRDRLGCEVVGILCTVMYTEENELPSSGRERPVPPRLKELSDGASNTARDGAGRAVMLETVLDNDCTVLLTPERPDTADESPATVDVVAAWLELRDCTVLLMLERPETA